jgi:hypothetical protein
MKHQTSIYFMAACFGLAAMTAGCASSPPAGQGTTGKGGGGGSATTGSGGTSGGGSLTALTPDMTGYVMAPAAIGIMGAWYGYGDGAGSDGTTATGDCEKAGHPVTACSSITTPMFGSFPPSPPTSSKMCTTGTVEKVIDIVGMAGMADYTAMWGSGIGLDLNNGGGANAVKMPYNATAAGVLGFAFDIDAVPLTGIRVEFPTPSTGTTAAIYKPGDSTTNFASPLVAGHNEIRWADIMAPSYVMNATAFDPTMIVSVQFHVPSSTSASANYTFCIDNFSAITQ